MVNVRGCERRPAPVGVRRFFEVSFKVGDQAGMKALLDDLARVRAARSKGAALVNPMVAEIADVLLMLGGSAHRDLVIDRVALRRGGHAASDALRRELVDAFDLHRERAVLEGRPSLLHLPFGEQTRRWALTSDAFGHLKTAVAVTAQ